MKKFNKTDMRGCLHSYNLEEKTNDKGNPYIVGTLSLQVDEQGNIIKHRYYATPVYSTGNINKSYKILEDIMAGNYGTIQDDGYEEAAWLQLQGNVDISYYIGRNGAKDVDDLVKYQQIRGSFINQNPRKEYSNKWSVDLYITRIEEVEADESRGTEEFVKVCGYLPDDYNKRVNEVIFEARSAPAMNYVKGIEASIDNPYAVSAWGGLMDMSIKSIKKNAFGEDRVEEFESKRWVITGMEPEPYNFGEEGIMTLEEWTMLRDNLAEFKQATLIKLQNREDEAEVGGGAGKQKLAF